jgi:hypothetical protein
MPDEKLKAKILSNYSTTLEVRKQKRMQKLKGMVRQLYTDGKYDEAEKVFDYLPALITHQLTNSVTMMIISEPIVMTLDNPGGYIKQRLMMNLTQHRTFPSATKYNPS